MAVVATMLKYSIVVPAKTRAFDVLTKRRKAFSVAIVATSFEVNVNGSEVDEFPTIKLSNLSDQRGSTLEWVVLLWVVALTCNNDR
jgi:hypothetical protein